MCRWRWPGSDRVLPPVDHRHAAVDASVAAIAIRQAASSLRFAGSSAQRRRALRALCSTARWLRRWLGRQHWRLQLASRRVRFGWRAIREGHGEGGSLRSLDGNFICRLPGRYVRLYVHVCLCLYVRLCMCLYVRLCVRCKRSERFGCPCGRGSIIVDRGTQCVTSSPCRWAVAHVIVAATFTRQGITTRGRRRSSFAAFISTFDAALRDTGTGAVWMAPTVARRSSAWKAHTQLLHGLGSRFSHGRRRLGCRHLLRGRRLCRRLLRGRRLCRCLLRGRRLRGRLLRGRLVRIGCCWRSLRRLVRLASGVSCGELALVSLQHPERMAELGPQLNRLLRYIGSSARLKARGRRRQDGVRFPSPG